MKNNIALVAKGVAIYSLAYLIAGGLAYGLLTKQFYVGDNPIFAGFLRSEDDATEWTHVNLWMIPALLLRGLLISVVLLPFKETLEKMTFTWRACVLSVLMFVLIHLAAAAPSPSNIEGLVYMKPQFIGVHPFLLTQPEMTLQCLLFALGLSWAMRKPPLSTTPKA
jgi:hypothetical protein